MSKSLYKRDTWGKREKFNVYDQDNDEIPPSVKHGKKGVGYQRKERRQNKISIYDV